MAALFVQVPCSYGNKLVVPGVTHLGKHKGKLTHLPFRSWGRALWQSRELGFGRENVTTNSQNALARPLGQAVKKRAWEELVFLTPVHWCIAIASVCCWELWVSQTEVGRDLCRSAGPTPWSGRITYSQLPRTMSSEFFNISKMDTPQPLCATCSSAWSPSWLCAS